MLNYDNNDYNNQEIIIINIGLFLILYTVLIAEKIPYFIIKFFDYLIVKIILILLIIFLSYKNNITGFIAVIAFSITLQTLQKYKYIKKSKK
jgi:hypothetical protein